MEGRIWELLEIREHNIRPTAVVEREQLIESHLPLVRAIARRYAGRGEAVEDLVQVGSIGLIRASDRFDPARGVAFATFATPAIEGEIRRHLGDRTTALRIPRELQRMTGQLQRSRAQLGASLGRAPTVDELATALGVEREDVERAFEAERARESRSGEADVDEVEGEYEFRPSIDDRLLLGLAARVLDERERRIVFLRFHADMTERDIARDLGISQAHVSRLLAGALAKLREELDDESSVTETADISETVGVLRTEEGAQAAVEPKIAAVGASQQKANRPGRSAKRKSAANRSGRFLVRMPSALHQELSTAAEREQVSLNRYVTDALAASVGAAGPAPPGQPTVAGGEATADSPPRPKRSFRMLLAANVIVMVLAASAAAALLILAINRGI